jgi:hypothetical protein
MELNALKSQLAQLQVPKTFNIDKINLFKQQIADIKGCKHVKREGESCTLNNNCKFPDCATEK